MACQTDSMGHNSQMSIQKVAVIGSGVMGSGIAAHIANAGLPVLLYDIEKPQAVIDKMTGQGTGGPLMHPSRASLIDALALGDDLDRLGEVDWVCEVIVEDLKVKQDLYAKIEGVRKDGCIVSSNTSTIPLAQLVDGRDTSFQAHFLITHFFNPPRALRLLELISGEHTDETVTARMHKFCEETLGKGVVPCFDRPGFIANRIGVHWLMTALHHGIEQGVDIGAADTALAREYGIPKTGAFGLMDLIGLDLMPKMAASLSGNLSQDDPFQRVAHSPQLLTDMIAAGYTGRKGKGGFTRLVKNADGSKTKLQIDLAKPFDPETSYAGAARKDPETGWAAAIMDDTLDYAAARLGEVADSKAAIDAAMVWGYNWARGPFALRGETIALPHPKEAIFVADYTSILYENDHAALHDMGRGIALMQHKTKMNVFDRGVFDALDKALDRDLTALVVATDSPHFSAGANINLFLEPAEAGRWDELEIFIKRGQDVMKRVRSARFPVVVAVNGYVLGGACELALHATAIVAHAETSIGLVEPRVGVIPGWGGCVEALQRLGALDALKTIMTQWTSGSALDAQQKGYLQENDLIVMNRDLLLRRALEHAMSLKKTAQKPFTPANEADRQAMQSWLDGATLSEHDRIIAGYLMETLSASDEESMWDRERDSFMALMRTEETQERICALLRHP